MSRYLTVRAEKNHSKILANLARKLKTLDEDFWFASDYEKTNVFSKIRKVKKLVEDLLECQRGGVRCQSSACQYCKHEVLGNLEKKMLRLQRKEALGQAYAVHLINPAWAVPLSSLHSFDVRDMKHQIEGSLHRVLPVNSKVVGTFDASFNTRFHFPKGGGAWPKSEVWTDHWQPHFHLIVWDTLPELIRKALKPHYIHDVLPWKAKPLVIQELSKQGFGDALHYALKNDYYRRVCFPKEMGKNPLKYDFQPSQFKEIWDYLSDIPMLDTLIIKGLETKVKDDGVVKFY